ncbi:hypothetical protein K7472_30410, partial [Streptomyces sp. PTM05]
TTGLALAGASVLLAITGIATITEALRAPVAPVPATRPAAATARVPPQPSPSSIPHTVPSGSSTVPQPTVSAAAAAAASGSSSGPGRTLLDDGPAGDPAIQRVLEASSPRNLPTRLEQQLTALARAVWLAQTTGTGRSTWPAYFQGADTHWLYTHVRIQAAIARATAPRQAEVHLVWTGTDPTGTEHDDQPATLHFQELSGYWQPTR